MIGSPLYRRQGRSIRTGRCSGQYYDPETDLFENWHRYYDANTGRYLEPDPIWKYPEVLVPRLATGHFDPVYAYGGNNPISNSDPDGRDFMIMPSGDDATDGAMNKQFDSWIEDKNSPMHEAAIEMRMSENLDVVAEGNQELSGGRVGETVPFASSSPDRLHIAIRIDKLMNVRADGSQVNEVHSTDQLGNDRLSTLSTVFAHEFGHATSYAFGSGLSDPRASSYQALQFENAQRAREGRPLADPMYGESLGSANPPLPAANAAPPSLPSFGVPR
jgi:RHS repeat-associated protein